GEQSAAIGTHFSGERDRLIAELSSQGEDIQGRIADELASAEDRARETVAATQAAWNSFTEELEQRFAQARTEALRAAQDIAAEEGSSLQKKMQEITARASADITAQVEELGREAAWQREKVERSVRETVDILRKQAQAAIADADDVFADLERIGAERVERIRRDAEDALVQSRDYVGQLQDSLGVHLEQLRERSAELAEEMNGRLTAITSATHDGVTQLDQYARDLLDAT